jgi:hypothetical protein
MLNTEATTKTCPFIQNLAAVIMSAVPENTSDLDAVYKNVPANIKCAAEACMAWHWHLDDSEYPDGKLKFSTTNGYCRLIHEGEV